MNGNGDDADFERELDRVVERFELSEAPRADSASPMRRRRGWDPEIYGSLATLSLIRDDGILRWLYEPPARAGSARRARRAAACDIAAERVYAFSFRELPPNELIEALENLDAKLTPGQGLRWLRDGRLEPVAAPKVKGRALLLVHGAFSRSDMFVDELGATAQGRALLERVEKQYDAVLAFDHPTLSVSPWINALDLEHALSSVDARLDVVAHSRGGIVTGWWLRNGARKVDEVVLVGCPMTGTSLASPARLRQALDMLANTFRALQLAGAAASTVVPMMAAVTGLAKIAGGVLRLGARIPLADAGVAIVPGMAGLSRVRNNAELRRLSETVWASSPNFHAVLSNFEPARNPAPWWQFWKHFRGLRGAALDAGADVVFAGPNDLVVDTEAMALVRGQAIPRAHQCDFGTSADVHHCNYFRQQRTIALLERVLQPKG